MSEDILLKLGDIKGGSSKDAPGRSKHGDQIILESWGFGVQNSADLHSGGSAQMASKPSVNDIEVTKWFDKASPNLLNAVCKRTHFEEATITVFTDDKVTCTIKLCNGVVVVSYELHNHMGPRMSETFRLHFGAFKLEYQPLDAKAGKDGGAISAEYSMSGKPIK